MFSQGDRIYSLYIRFYVLLDIMSLRDTIDQRSVLQRLEGPFKFLYKGHTVFESEWNKVFLT